MIKVGYAGFWQKNVDGLIYGTLLHSIHNIIKPTNCYNEECDIVIISIFNNEEIKQIKGNPIKIFWHGENHLRFDIRNIISNMQYDYSLTDKTTTNTNLCFTYLDLRILEMYKQYFITNYRTQYNKEKFATFIVSNDCCGILSKERINITKELQNYKRVDCLGKCLNNVGGQIQLPWNKMIEYHQSYKFNICFENSIDNDTNCYITEKIFNAYLYNTVPIYKGSNYVTQYFNPKSFINGNGKTIQEIIEEVKYYDTHDDDYYTMLKEPIFNDINIYENVYNKLNKFLLYIIQKHFPQEYEYINSTL